MNGLALYVAITAIPGMALLWLAYLGWKRRYTPGSRHFIVLVTAVALWSLAFSLELLADDLHTKITWLKLKYAGIVVVPVALLTFSLRYTRNDRFLNSRTIAALMALPTMSLLMAWTNELHHLFWREITLSNEARIANIPVLDIEPGAWFGLHLIYSYTLVFLGSLLLIRSAFYAFDHHRQQSIVILAALGIGVLGNVLTILQVVPNLDLTPPFFTVSTILIAVGLLRFGLLDTVPLTYDTVLVNLPDGVCVVDGDWRVQTVNPAFAKMFGVDGQKVVGRLIGDVLPQVSEKIPHFEQSYDLRTEIALPDCHLDLRINPLKDSRGRVQGRVYIFRDITDKKQIEFELHDRVNQLMVLRQVYDETGSTLAMQEVELISLDAAMRLSGAASGYIAVLRGDQMMVDEAIGNYKLDDAARVRLPNEGIVGRVLQSHVPELVLDVRDDPDDVPHIENTIARMVIPFITQEQQLIGVLNLETPKPERFTESVFEFLQTVAGHLAIVLDNARLHRQTQDNLTEMQQLYHRVKRLEQLKTDMIRIAAHDLGNPLTAMKTRIDLMLELDREMLNETQLDDMQTMQNAANRMRSMLDNILSLERIEQLADSGAFDIVDLPDRVLHAVEEYYKQSIEKSQTLVYRHPSRDIMVEGDVNQLYEAITNLISNAVKYTPKNGTITVSLSHEGDMAVFKVEDTGYGIPKEKQDRLFQPFYRVRTEETGQVDGTGLGLHLVKNIIERHNGTMLFHSEYGKGSTFGFQLPITRIPARIDR